MLCLPPLETMKRLDVYLGCPDKFFTLIHKWFPLTYRHAVTWLLQASEQTLAVGVGLPLQGIALAQGGESLQRGFLLSSAVQEHLEEAATAFFATSLAAERKAAEVKRREARSITLLGNVSRELLCRRFARAREVEARALLVAAEEVQTAKRKSWHAILWGTFEAPRSIPWPILGATSARGPATGGHLGTRAATDDSTPVATPRKCDAGDNDSPASGLKRRGNAVTGRKIIKRRNKEEPEAARSGRAIRNKVREQCEPATGGTSTGSSVKEECDPATSGRSVDRPKFEQWKPATGGSSISSTRRQQCKAERIRRINEATSRLEHLQNAQGIIPVTRLQWARWVGDNLEELRERMRKEAAPRRRQQYNIRVAGRPGLPRAARRLQPQAERNRVTTEWGKLLELRTGWYGLDTASGRRMFFVLYHLGCTYVVDMESHRVPGPMP